MTDFEALLRALTEHDVNFIVVGGVAAVAHGSARLTQDLDVVYARDPDNIRHLVGALEEHSPYLRGAPPGLPFEWSIETVSRGLNFPLTSEIGDIDLLGEIVGGGGYDDLISHTVELSLFGIECRCLDLPTLIRVKRAAGRPRDLEAVAEFEALLEETEDGTSTG